jgi:hypothetical protein
MKVAIDRLVVDGIALSRAERRALVESVQRELAGRLAGTPPGAPHTPVERLGRDVAAGVHAAIGPLPGRAGR